jgi:hypothetical protein
MVSRTSLRHTTHSLAELSVSPFCIDDAVAVEASPVDATDACPAGDDDDLGASLFSMP